MNYPRTANHGLFSAHVCARKFLCEEDYLGCILFIISCIYIAQLAKEQHKSHGLMIFLMKLHEGGEK